MGPVTSIKAMMNYHDVKKEGSPARVKL